MTVPAVSVVIPARDAEATLGAALAALNRQDLGDPFEIIVADDGSTDRTRAIAEEWGARVVAVAHSTGAGSVRNAGAAVARADVLAFTDADCAPTPGWLREGLRAMEHADLVQGRVLPDPAAELGPYDRSLWVTNERGFYETANLFVRREHFDAVGGFEDVIGRERRPQGEDTLLGWRIRRVGGRSAFASDALVHHAVFPRGAREWILDRRRWRHLPAVVAAVPELRDHLCYRRVFFEHRTGAFDAALAGVVLALVAVVAGVGPAGLLPLVLAWPYARVLAAEVAALSPRRRAGYALARPAADAVALAALLRGSLTAQRILL